MTAQAAYNGGVKPERLQIRIDTALLARVQAQADREGESLAVVVRRALREYLAEHEPADQEAASDED